MVSLGFHLGFIQGFFRVSFRVYFELFVDFFRVHVEFHVGFLIRISLGFLCVSPRVSLGFHFGYKQERIAQKNMKNRGTVKTGSREAEEQEVEQQRHMTEEKKT